VQPAIDKEFRDSIAGVFGAAIDTQDAHGRSVPQQQRGRRALLNSCSRKKAAYASRDDATSFLSRKRL
jgi:hypothetical protein